MALKFEKELLEDMPVERKDHGSLVEEEVGTGSVMLSPVDHEDNSREVDDVLSHIATLGDSESKLPESHLSREMEKRAEYSLEDIDKKLAIIKKREEWFGGVFIIGNRIKKRGEDVTIERRDLAESTWGPFIESVNLPVKILLKAVRDSGPTEEFTHRLTENIRIIKKLEKRIPGAAGRLYKDYGVLCFSRYPVHMLCRQLEQEGDSSFPYGVVLYSREDWNGAFDGAASEEELSLLDVATEKVGLGVRIFECGSLVDTAKHLVRLNRDYGEKQKIQFVIVSGHGTQNSIHLGSRNLEKPSEDLLSKLSDLFFGFETKKREDIFPEKSLKCMKDFFIHNPTLILNSCLTAKGETGLAHLLASVTGSDVIASGKPVGEFVVRNIQKIADRYQFDVTFAEKGLLGDYAVNSPKTIHQRGA